MSFLSEAEKLIKQRSPSRLAVAIFYYGLDIEVFEAQLNQYSKVYGSLGGEQHTFKNNIKGIISTDVGFAPFDNAFSGNFEEGFLYTTDIDKVNVGDLIKITSEDNRSRRFKIADKQSVGHTDEVFPRFVIVAIGD